MDTGRFLFDPSFCQGNMSFLGNGDQVFRGPRSTTYMEETTKRRPFFRSPEDIYEDDYYDEQLPEKKRRLTSEQVNMLEKSFEEETKLEPERKTRLAKKLGLQPRQVAVWFQNRRARWRTKQLERDYDVLKTSYDSLVSGYDFIFKENEKLKSEVALLIERLQAKEVALAAISCLKSNSLPVDGSLISDIHLDIKVEDHISSGSGESAVLDEDNNPQVMDSGVDYHFHSNQFLGDGFHSTEEEDGSEDGQSYFTDSFAATEQQQEEDGENLGWWVWS